MSVLLATLAAASAAVAGPHIRGAAITQFGPSAVVAGAGFAPFVAAEPRFLMAVTAVAALVAGGGLVAGGCCRMLAGSW